MKASVEALSPPFRVKVCGLTRPADVDVAAAAGADAVGVVSHRASPRHVELLDAQALLARRPAGVLGVLVVVDARPAELEARARATGADLVQLCGSESPTDFAGFPVPILRRVPVDARADAELRAWSQVAAAFLLDHPSAAGGTGLEVDLARAAALCRTHPCVLAGGLDGDGVAARVAATGTRAVDASSRLEQRPGVKDPDRVRAYVRAALDALDTTAGSSPEPRP